MPKQQQNHDAGAEGHDLHDAFAAPPTEVCNTESPRNAHAAAQPARQKHEKRAGERQHQQEAAQAGGEADEQLPVAHHPVDEKHDDCDGRPEGQQHQGGRWADVPAQYPQSRRARELQQRRQRESNQHGNRRHESNRSRDETGRRQVHGQQAADRSQEPLLGQVAESATQHRRDDRNGDELQDVHRQGERSGCAECLQQGHCVEVAVDVLAG